ncbi:MAG: hypothetical protein ACR2NZ_01280 [Rubripirellula sp.]
MTQTDASDKETPTKSGWCAFATCVSCFGDYTASANAISLRAGGCIDRGGLRVKLIVETERSGEGRV